MSLTRVMTVYPIYYLSCFVVKTCVIEEAHGSVRILTSSPSLLVYVSSMASPSWCLKRRPFQMALSQPLLPPWRWCDPLFVASCNTALQQSSFCSVQLHWTDFSIASTVNCTSRCQ